MRRTPLVLLTAVTALTVALAAAPASAAPATRTPGKAIEGFAAYQPQSTCSPTAKPGTIALRTLIMSTYGGTGDYGIIRDCTLGGRSEHKEGRAWDWKVSSTNAANVKQVNDMLHWLFATDRYGNTFAQARRLGIMYLIWNHRIWNADSHAWKAYTGTDPHTSHVHFSLSWAGALKKTSYWTNVVSGPVAAPKPPVVSKPTTTQPTTPKPTTPTVLTTAATLRVTATSGTPTTSRFLLAGAQSYLVRSTSYYFHDADRTAKGSKADAECSQWADGTWQRRTPDEQDDPQSQQLDLQLNGTSTRWSTQGGDSCDPTTHTYWTVVDQQTTGPLSLKVLDSDYTDNLGYLTVTVSPLGQGAHH